MEHIIWFAISFVLIYILYFILFILKTRRNNKIPAEAQYLISIYHLDINKFSYQKFIRIVGLVTSLDIAIAATLVTRFDGMIWQLLFGFVVIVPIIVISFFLLGKYYQKKQNMDNSKELFIEENYLKKVDKIEKKYKKLNKKGKKKNDKQSINRK